MLGVDQDGLRIEPVAALEVGLSNGGTVTSAPTCDARSRKALFLACNFLIHEAFAFDVSAGDAFRRAKVSTRPFASAARLLSSTLLLLTFELTSFAKESQGSSTGNGLLPWSGVGGLM
jgi:hypothetical protein